MGGFSNHIPRSGLPSFNEGSSLRSPRDADSISKAWQKDRTHGRRQSALSNNVSQLHKAVSSLRKRVLSPYSYRPFFIYNVNPGLLLPKGSVRTDPFNHGRLPTVDDAWRTFQIRGGLVGCRPQFLISPLIGTGITGGFEYQIPIFGDGADGAVGFLNSDWYADTQLQDGDPELNISFPLETINIPNTGDVTASAPVDPLLPNAVRWVLNSDLDEFHSTNASFWIEITDDAPASFPKAKIKARMWTGQTDDRTGRSTSLYPSVGPNIIPLGTVSPRKGIYIDSADAYDLVGTSVLDDHVTNRYGPGVLGTTATSPTHIQATGPRYFRGFYYPDNDDPFKDPDGIFGTVWYPGDSVSVWTQEVYLTDATLGGGTPDSVTLNVTKEYMYFGDPAIVTSIGDSHLVQVSGMQPQA